MTSIALLLVTLLVVVSVSDHVHGMRHTSAYYSMPSYNLANVLFSRRQTRMARYMHHPYHMGQLALVQNKGRWDNMVIIVDDSWRVGRSHFKTSVDLVTALMSTSHARHSHPDRLSMAVSMATLSHPYYARPLTNNARTADRRLTNMHYGGGVVDQHAIERSLRTASRLLLNAGGDRLVVLLLDANNLRPAHPYATTAQYPTALTLRENGVTVVVVARGSYLGGVQQRGTSLTGDQRLVIPTGYSEHGAKQLWHRVAQAIAQQPIRS